MATNSPNPVPVSIHPEIAAVARNADEPQEVVKARLDALRCKIAAEGVNRPIYVWPNEGQQYVLEGIDVFTIASELGLKPDEDYMTVPIELPDLDAAKQWRFERAATTQREVSELKRCLDTLKLYKNEMIA